MTEEIVEGGMSTTKTIVKWKLNNFAQMFIHDVLVKKQKMEFEITNSERVTSKWEMSLDFEKDSEEQNTSSSNGGSSPTEYLMLVVDLVSTSNNASVNTKIIAEFEGKNETRIFKGNSSVCPKYEAGDNVSWLIKNMQKNADISHLLTAEGSLLVKLDVTIFEVLGQTPNEKDFEAGLLSKQKESCYRMIASLENDKSHSDVRIVSEDGLEYFAHRWILSGASDVFEAMFRADMKEKGSGLVKLEDLSGNAVKILLHFIYTGKMAEEWKTPGTIEEVIYIADKYQITNMKDYIDVKIAKVCTPENAATLMALVNRTGLKRAASEIQKFIMEKGQEMERLLEILNNGYQSSDNNAVTDTVTNTSTAVTSSNLPKPTLAKRGRKRKNI